MPLLSPESLRTSGLAEREALVWYTLTKHKGLHITQIAEHTKLHRPAVYAELKRLTQKGLVACVDAPGRKRYQSTGVRAFTRWSHTQARAFRTSILELHTEEDEPMPKELQIYRGKDIRRVWELLAQSPKKTVFYRYDAYPASFSVDRYIPKAYIEGLKSRGLERFVITNKALRQRAYQKRIECASRVLPGTFDPFEQGMTQFIFGDTLAFVDFTTEIAFVIKNPVLAAFHLRLFKYLYRTLAE